MPRIKAIEKEKILLAPFILFFAREIKWAHSGLCEDNKELPSSFLEFS